MYSVDQIVGRHDCRRGAFFYRDLKPPQIDLAERPLRNTGIHSHPVIFLIIAGKMLDRYTASCFILHSPGDCGGEYSREKRIFREIFKITPAERVSLDIHAGCKPEIDMEFPHLLRDRTSKLSEQLRIPGLRQSSACRERRTVMIICIRVFMDFHRFQKSVFKRPENAGSIYGICLPIDLIALPEPEPCRSVRHDQRTDPVLFF